MRLMGVHSYYLGGLSAEVTWVGSAFAPASEIFRCKHNSLPCTTSRRFSDRDSLFSGYGVSLHSYKKERGQCSLPTEVFVAREKRLLTKKISSNSDSRRADCGGNGGQFRSHLQQDGGWMGDNTTTCLYIKKTIDKGEVVEHSGSIVILGDVKPGGHVLADGDVVVLGRLQGNVHAGRTGASTSRVFATAMEPQEIRICDSALFCPKNDGTHIPKMAFFLPDGGICICPAVKDSRENQIVPICRSGHKQVGIGGQGPVQTTPKVQIHQTNGLRNQGPARVALVTGVYISIAGIALLGYPKVLFGILFNLQGVTLGWVQVGAVLAVVFGVYYIGTAIGDMRGMHGAEAFYLSTVIGRTFLFLSFFWLAVTGAVPSPLLLVGAVNLVGAIVMLKALLKAPVRSSG